MRTPRGLSAGEAALWAQVAQTVTPINPPRPGEGDHAKHGGGARAVVVTSIEQDHAPVPHHLRWSPSPKGEDRKPQTLDRHGLDSSWERKLAKAAIAPDFTLDLHGYGLDAAHDRLDQGLTLALAQGARMVLVITGLARPVDAADRGSRRGAIRAKLLDWLAAGPHGSRIAAVRPAHPRHGGAGAVYVVLRRPSRQG